MADVFISYSRDDRPRVAPFVELLESQGWTVWWDSEVEPGHSFGDEIDLQVSSAACVVVFWSRHSIHSNWVRVEANEGLERGVLVPLLLDDVRPPLVFRATETVSLLGWPQHEKRNELERALRAIAGMIGRHADNLSLAHRRPGLVRAAAAIAAVIVVVAIAAGVLLDLRHRPESVARAPLTAKPVASIAVLPFSNMEVDIAPELSRLLGGTGSFFVEGGDQIRAWLQNPARFNLDARYTVQGAKSAAGLTVSVFDRDKRETLWSQTLETRDVPVPQLVQTIATDVAGVFNRPAIRVDDVPHDAYIEFLEARAQSRADLGPAGEKKAVQLYEKVIASAPRFAEAYAGLCQTYTSMYKETRDVKYFQQAEQRCFRASALSDDNVYVDIALGELYRISGRLNASLERLEAARQKTPFSTDVMRQLALVKHRLNLDDEAEALMQYAQELEPNNWENYDTLAKIYYETGRYSDAAHEFARETTLVADKTRALNNVGSAWYMAGNFQKAIDAWKESLQAGGSPQLVSNLGTAYFYNGDFDKAAASYKKAADLHPDDARYWANIGEAVMQTGKDATPYYEKAIKLALAKLEINPNDGESLSLAAESYASVGNAKASRRYIARSLSVGRENLDALYSIALAYARLGEDKKEKATLDRMVAMGYSRKLLEKDANFNGGKSR